MNVPATELINSPETPKSQSLTTPSRVRRTFGGLMSRWMVLRACKYASPCKTCRRDRTRGRRQCHCPGAVRAGWAQGRSGVRGRTGGPETVRTPSASRPATLSLTRPPISRMRFPTDSSDPPSQYSMSTLTSLLLGLMYAPQKWMMLTCEVLDVIVISRSSCFMGASSVVIVLRAITTPVRRSRTL